MSTYQGKGRVAPENEHGGRPLRALLEEEELDIPTALRVVRAVAKALGELHRRGLVHRDVRPESVYLDRRTGEVELAHVDRAVRAGEWVGVPLSVGAIEGSLSHVSPEQTGLANRPVDPRSDFYSLGVTLYELLTGRLPLRDSEPLELVRALLDRVPEPPMALRPNVPQAVSALTMKLLAKRADDRYQSALGLVLDLDECISQVEGEGTIKGLVPGEHDVPNGLLLSSELFGLDAEVAALSQAFERARAGGLELVVVSGPSGSGKTSLIGEIFRLIVMSRGLWGRGRFERGSLAPFGALGQALRGPVQQILAGGDEPIARFRGRLGDALGARASALAELVPELHTLLGELAPAPALDPAEAEARFVRLVRGLLEGLARDEQPVVLLLDDLHWADASALALLRALLEDPGRSHLVVVGAYEDEEVGEGHPLRQLLASMEGGRATLRRIAKRPLGLGEVERMIDQALGHAGASETRTLAERCHRATAGNPLALRALFASLYRRDAIGFDPDRACFDLRIEKVDEALGGWTVEGSIDERLSGLGEAGGSLLGVAARLGLRFELRALAAAVGRSSAEVARELERASEAGLIVARSAVPGVFSEESSAPLGGLERAVDYEFAHPRVRERVRATTRREDALASGSRIARALLPRLARAGQDDELIARLELVDPEAARALEPGERDDLGAAFARAGRGAQAMAAHASARALFARAEETLGEGAWERSHALRFAIGLGRAISEARLGEGEQAERGFLALRSRAASAQERLRVERIRMVLGSARGQHEAALAAATAGLALLGVALDRPQAEIERASVEERDRVLAQLTPSRIAALAGAKVTDDEETLARASFFDEVLRRCPSLPHASARWLSALALREALDALDARGAPSSCGAWVLFAQRLAAELGDHRGAFALGDAALRVASRAGDPSQIAEVQLGVGACLAPWRESLRSSVAQVEQAYARCLEEGALGAAGRAATTAGFQRFVSGDELAGLDERALRHLDELERSGAERHAAGLVALRALIAALREEGAGAGPRSVAKAASLGPPEAGPRGGDAQAATSLIAAVFLGDPAQAIEAGDSAIESLARWGGEVLEAELRLHRGLSIAAVEGQGVGEVERARASELWAHEAWLAHRAELCPTTFAARASLLSAEIARKEGRALEAMTLYDRAIDVASLHEQTPIAALASELAARFHRGADRERIASAYLEEARRAYARWGAGAKLAQLSRELGVTTSRPSVRGPASARGADVARFVQASRAFVEATSLGDRLRALLGSALDGAGAQRGFLIVVGEDALFIEGSGPPGERELCAHEGSIDGRHDLAGSVVRRVERTLEEVVLADVTSSDFCSDPHVLARRPRWIVCVPIVGRGPLDGILYVEGSQAHGAFVPERGGGARAVRRAGLGPHRGRPASARAREAGRGAGPRARGDPRRARPGVAPAEGHAEAAHRAGQAGVARGSHRGDRPRAPQPPELREQLRAALGRSRERHRRAAALGGEPKRPGRAGRAPRRSGDARAERGQDQRARAPRGQHHQRDAGPRARHHRRARGGGPERARAGLCLARLPWDARQRSELQHRHEHHLRRRRRRALAQPSGHQPSVDQRDQQRLLRHAAEAAGARRGLRADLDGAHDLARRSRRGAHPRQRDGDRRRRGGQDLPALLHDEAPGRRHRARPLAQPRHRRARAPRRAPRGDEARRVHRVRHRLASRRPGALACARELVLPARSPIRYDDSRAALGTVAERPSGMGRSPIETEIVSPARSALRSSAKNPGRIFGGRN
jgi:histidine kinase